MMCFRSHGISHGATEDGRKLKADKVTVWFDAEADEAELTVA